jgi:hypothetical protein
MMTAQPQLLHIPLNLKDVVYTTDWVARDMVEFFKPSGRILEPCAGAGVFMKYLPPHTEWCEIERGRDFFNFHEPVDWCFGNPPYGMFAKWMRHSYTIAKHICYLLPLNKTFLSKKNFDDLEKFGWPRHMRFYGNGSAFDEFKMGFAVGAMLFERDYHGEMGHSIARKENSHVPLPLRLEKQPPTRPIPMPQAGHALWPGVPGGGPGEPE